MPAPTDSVMMPTAASVGECGKLLDETTRVDKGYTGFDGKNQEYCPYTETSQNYDGTRKPLGVSLIVGSFAMSPTVPLAEQYLLDVGCGTGTFMDEVYGKFNRITGLEYNIGMISQARARSKDDVQLVQGSADALPFADDAFHAAVINQVVHHFPADGDYKMLANTFKECLRVLKPGGRLVLQTSTKEQQRDGFWWGSIIPQGIELVCKRFAPLSTVLKHMRDAGFTVDESAIAVPMNGTLMAPEKYLQNGTASAFSKAYRDGDSSWAASESLGELKGAIEKVRVMEKEGMAGVWLAERETLRKTIGQATFITACKPITTKRPRDEGQ